MSYRFGNRYIVAIGPEYAFGSGTTGDGTSAWSALTALACKMEESPTRTALETGYKTGTAQATANEINQGYKDGQVTLTGTLASQYAILLRAALHDSSSPYATADAPTAQSFVIARVYDDAPSMNNYQADVASGCRCESFNITGASGGLVQFTATFRMADFAKENSAFEITGVHPGVPTPTAFNFGSVTYNGNYGEKTILKSFNFTITNTYLDDTGAYANSNTRLRDVLLKQEAELNLVGNYNQEAPERAPMNKINSGASTDILAEVLALVNASNTWTLTAQTLLTSQTLADPERAVFDTNVTLRCVKNSTTAAVSIAVT